MSAELLLRHILADAVDALTQTAPTRQIIVPGIEPVADCEQVYVRVDQVTSIYQRGESGCPVAREWSLKVGVMRCHAVVNDQGQPPSGTQITADGLSELTDNTDLFDAFAAWDPPREIRSFVLTSHIGSWTPLPTEGGFGGGEWDVIVRTQI